MRHEAILGATSSNFISQLTYLGAAFGKPLPLGRELPSRRGSHRGAVRQYQLSRRSSWSVRGTVPCRALRLSLPGCLLQSVRLSFLYVDLVYMCVCVRMVRKYFYQNYFLQIKTGSECHLFCSTITV